MLLEADGSCIMTVTVTFLDQKKKKKYSPSLFSLLSRFHSPPLHQSVIMRPH